MAQAEGKAWLPAPAEGKAWPVARAEGKAWLPAVAHGVPARWRAGAPYDEQ